MAHRRHIRRASLWINLAALCLVAVAATGCIIETDGGGYHHHHWHGWHEWR